jgi:hypothetical protein
VYNAMHQSDWESLEVSILRPDVTMAPAIEHIRAGKLPALAVTTSVRTEGFRISLP